jgi:hypothetical protein
MGVWMRLRRNRHDEPLDPELLTLFGSQVHLPELDESVRMRSRARVAGQLVQGSAGRGVFRRVALAGFGGGGLWAALSSVAMAHKAAATIAGVSLLVGGAVAIETSGAGPSVRGALGVATPAEQASSAPGGLTEAVNPDVGPADHAPAPVEVDRGDGEKPGNLVTLLRADGSFTLRAVLRAVVGDQLALDVGGEALTLRLAAEAQIQAPGSPGGSTPPVGAAQLDNYIDHLVVVAGTCGGADAIDETCEITLLQVLGEAGQEPPRPEGQGQPADAVPPVEPGPPADPPHQPSSPGDGNPPTELPTPPTSAGEASPASTPAAADGRP